MEQLQQLLDILGKTPKMALWGLIVWCLYILAKLSSVVYAVKIIFHLAITKWHDYKIKQIDINKLKEEHKIELAALDTQKLILESSKHNFKLEQKYNDISRLATRFQKVKISSIEMDSFIKLIDAVKSSHYIHQSDIDKAIRILTKNKE